MRSTSVSPASMSTPAPRYVIPEPRLCIGLSAVPRFFFFSLRFRYRPALQAGVAARRAGVADRRRPKAFDESFQQAVQLGPRVRRGRRSESSAPRPRSRGPARARRGPPRTRAASRPPRCRRTGPWRCAQTGSPSRLRRASAARRQPPAQLCPPEKSGARRQNARAGFYHAWIAQASSESGGILLPANAWPGTSGKIATTCSQRRNAASRRVFSPSARAAGPRCSRPTWTRTPASARSATIISRSRRCGGSSRCSTPAPSSRPTPRSRASIRSGFRDSKRYADRLRAARRNAGGADAVLVGTGKLDGQPVEVGVFVFEFMGGSMGSVVGEKVTRVFERALERQVPAIVFSASGGARMQEGVLSLMQMAKTSAALGRLREAGCRTSRCCSTRRRAASPPASRCWAT